MLTFDQIDSLVAASLQRLGVTLHTKPVIFGGLAMEYYGLRTHGDDIDLLVSPEDQAMLWARYPDQRKDMWGDLGVLVDGVELFRSVYRLDAEYLGEGAVELAHCRIISADRLLMMKWLAQGSTDKNERDLELLREWFLRHQNPQWEAYKDGRVPHYLAAPKGTLIGSQIDEV